MADYDISMSPLKASEADAFVACVWENGAQLYRDLPWRNTRDPYAVWISEVMLQQTQVKRVLDYWPAFLSAFPTVDALAAASTTDVLERWQGLGYNRRGLALKQCADIIAQRYRGVMPQQSDQLQELPGIGPATAAGIRAFAFGLPGVYLETNVRTVYLHHFFAHSDQKVADRQLIPYIEGTVSHSDPRGWYYALLDYGNHLKKTLVNPSRRSAHHTRQSTFEGSRRQKRAELLRIVLGDAGITCAAAHAELDAFEKAAGRDAVDDVLFEAILNDLVTEGFFRIQQNRIVP